MVAHRSDPNGTAPTAGAGAARWSLIGLELLVAVNAGYGGVGLMLNGLGMPAEWLAGTPFDTWVLPGVFLLAVVAAPMAVAAAAELTRRSWAFAASLAAGTLQAGWIVAQVAIIQRYFVLQPVMFAAGVLVVLLAVWAHRGAQVAETHPRSSRSRSGP